MSSHHYIQYFKGDYRKTGMRKQNKKNQVRYMSHFFSLKLVKIIFTAPFRVNFKCLYHKLQRCHFLKKCFEKSFINFFTL